MQHTSFVHFFVAVLHRLRACLHEGGGSQVGEVTRGGLPHLTCKRDHIKMRDCMDRRVTPPKRVTSPTWGPPPPCKQALRLCPHVSVFVWKRNFFSLFSKKFASNRSVFASFSHRFRPSTRIRWIDLKTITYPTTHTWRIRVCYYEPAK